MRIRTRLLVSLLPTLVGGIILIALVLCYSWRAEITNSYKARFQSALSTTAILLKTGSVSNADLRTLWEPFGSYRLFKIDGKEQSVILVSDEITHSMPRFAYHPDDKIHYSKEKDGQFISAAALISSDSFLIAETQISLLNQMFLEHISQAVIGVILLVLIAVASLYFMSGKISVPVQKLNNSALAIAAGQYGESIQVHGPKEFQELANTLNTMSECLLENINRLKENSLLRERMYGETECARLLQHLMLQKNIDECASESIVVKAITFSSATPRGLLVDFPTTSDRPEILSVHLAEAKVDGFDGMYQLLTQYKLFKDHPQEKLPFPSLRLTLNRETGMISARTAGSPVPYLWSALDGELREIKGKKPVAAGDFVYMMNRGCYSFFKEPLKINDLLTKVSKHFAQDGLETTVGMLHKEITFATKCKDLQEDLHLLCIQILKPSLT